MDYAFLGQKTAKNCRRKEIREQKWYNRMFNPRFFDPTPPLIKKHGSDLQMTTTVKVTTNDHVIEPSDRTRNKTMFCAS